VARLLDLPRTHLLRAREARALNCEVSRQGIIIPEIPKEDDRDPGAKRIWLETTAGRN
jgi:hypothetical protein